MVVRGISLGTRDMEHLPICPLATCVSSLETRPLGPLPTLSVRVLV